MIAASSVSALVFLRAVVDTRDQAKVDVALAERLQRLAFKSSGAEVQNAINRIGQQQDFDAAGRSCSSFGIGFQPLNAVACQKVDLGLIGFQIRDILLQRRFSPAVVVKRDSASNFSRRS